MKCLFLQGYDADGLRRITGIADHVFDMFSSCRCTNVCDEADNSALLDPKQEQWTKYKCDFILIQ